MTTQLDMLTTLQNTLQAIVWPGVGGGAVFASSAVVVTAGPQESALQNLRAPILLIRPQDAAVDAVADEEPNLLRLSIAMRLIVRVAGDATGQASLLGHANPSALTSAGRGLLEVEQEVLRAVQFLNANNSLTIQHRSSSMAAATLMEGLGYLAFRDYAFEAWVTAI